MELEKGVISKHELIFLYIVLFQGASVTSAFVSNISKRDTWIVNAVAFMLSFLLVVIYVGISSKFPDKTLIDINDIVYGRYLGKIISIVYISNFFFAGAANTRYAGDFFVEYFFPETDLKILILLIIIVCIYMVMKGIETIVRMALIFVVITLVVINITAGFTIQYMKMSNLLPFLDINIRDFIQCVNIMICVPFGVITVFFMLNPFTNFKGCIRKYTYIGFALGGLYMVMVPFRNTIILGELQAVINVPAYQISELARIRDLDIEVESVASIVILFDVFMEIGVFVYVTVLATAQLIKLKKYNVMAIIIGIMTFVSSLYVFDSTAEHKHIVFTTYFMITDIPIVILPVITRIIIAIRKL